MTPDQQNAPEGRKSDGVVVRCLMTERQAYALAQLCKRIGWADARGLAVDELETSAMLTACDVVRAGLEDAGVWVR